VAGEAIEPKVLITRAPGVATKRIVLSPIYKIFFYCMNYLVYIFDFFKNYLSYRQGGVQKIFQG
jgi:hypothetical protein